MPFMSAEGTVAKSALLYARGSCHKKFYSLVFCYFITKFLNG